jgi:hypothetical protein
MSVPTNLRTVTKQSSPQKPKGYIPLLSLLLFAFSSAFFPRVLLLVKFPSIVTLLYLVIVPAVALLILVKTKVKNRIQIGIVKELLVALFIFFGVNISSALLNGAGLINACLDFLFFCLQFLFLIALISLPLTQEKLQQFRNFVILASFTNLLFALVQGVIYRGGNPDWVKGVFIDAGAGHVLGTSVSLTFVVYYIVDAKNVPLWFRGVVALAALVQMNMSDAKQVMLCFMVAGVFLFILKLKDIGAAIQYLTGAVVFGYAFHWATQNIPALDAFNTWMRPEIYGPEGEATLLKTATFRIVPTFYHSPLNPWLGLGPGHTVGRLGGWMLGKYSDLLGPLGSTIHPASAAVWKAVAESWLGDQSSMFSPLFGWAAIWGDLGWLGLISFLYIWFVVWRRLCFDDVSKFLALTPLVSGFIFTQMEEPGYMIYVAAIIGLRWHGHQYNKKQERELRVIQ